MSVSDGTLGLSVLPCPWWLWSQLGGGGESALCLVLHSQHTYFLSNPHHFH